MDNTIPFRQLEKKDVLKIIDLMLDKVAMYLRNKRITADFTDNLREMVFDRGFSKRFGARSLQRTVDKEIVRCLAEKILKEEIKESARIRVDYKKDKIQVRLLKSKIPVKRQKGLVKKKIIEVTSTE
jgi:ATP-dependent Clp protease ATP-binding subunit ClpA